MTFTVTKKDVASFTETHICPVNSAIIRILKRDDVVVGHTNVVIGRKKIKLPEEIISKIKYFDATLTMKPFRFELNV